MRALGRALDMVLPSRVAARARAADEEAARAARAAEAAVAAAPVEAPAPLTEAARYLTLSGVVGAGGVGADAAPSMLLADDVLHEVRPVASRGRDAALGRAPSEGAGGGLPRALERLVAWDETGEESVLDLRDLSGLTNANDVAYPSPAAFGDGRMLTRAAYRACHGREPHIRFEMPQDAARLLDELHRVLGLEPWRVYRRAWDGRRFLGNSNGAHRLAALHRYCRERGVALSVRARIARVRVDEDAARVLDAWDVWRVAPATYDALAAALRPAGVCAALDGVYERERRSGVGYDRLSSPAAALFALPAGHWAADAVRARLVLALAADPGAAFDLSAHVRETLAAQRLAAR